MAYLGVNGAADFAGGRGILVGMECTCEVPFSLASHGDMQQYSAADDLGHPGLQNGRQSCELGDRYFCRSESVVEGWASAFGTARSNSASSVREAGPALRME